MADISAVKEITDRLETGVKELFESDKYKAYLQTMSRFHSYSTRNVILVHLQRPDATRIAGYQAWKSKFNRQVKKGEHGIKIFAPIPFVIKEEKEKLDPVTKKPIIGEDGQPVMEEYIKAQSARFKIVSVFDVAQTVGEPLPELAETLTGNVERYELFMDALRKISPLPIVFEDMPLDTDGRCVFGDRIAIRSGMSEVQTVAAVIHEITHAKLHDIETLRLADPNAKSKDRRTEEIEAESVSYAVNQYYGIDTAANSFGYLAEWGKTTELKELNASLDIIRKTSAELIDGIDGQYRELAKERGIDLSAAKRKPGTLERIVQEKKIKSPDWDIPADAALNDRAEMISRIITHILTEDPGHPVKSINAMIDDYNDADIEGLREAYQFFYHNEQVVERIAKSNGYEPKETAKPETLANTEPVMPDIAEPDIPVITGLDMSLPDPTVTVAKMNEYGYTDTDMHPLSPGRALELYDTGHTVYLLHPDNTEGMAFDREEIRNHDGYCGITHEDWEHSPVKTAQMSVTAAPVSEKQEQPEEPYIPEDANLPEQHTPPEASQTASAPVTEITTVPVAAKAIHSAQQPAMRKGKPSIFARLEYAKRQLEQQNKTAAAVNRKEREV